jgi:WD40 repeat protein
MSNAHTQVQRDVSLALIALAVREPAELNPYLIRHLSGHIAEGNTWRSLAAMPALLDQLDPSAVTTDALRSIFKSDHIPPEIAGVIASHHKLQIGRRSDIAGIRQLATSFVQGFLLGSEAPSSRSTWTVHWAVTPSQRLHLTLPAHLGFVNEICTIIQDEYTLLASGGDDFLVRIWDPLTAAPRGEPLRAHTGTVEAVCEIRLPNGRAGVASGGSDGIVCAWDVAAGRLHVPPMLGHDGTVRALCSIAQPAGGSWIVSAGYDGTVRVWDLNSGGRCTAVLRGHQGPVVALAPSVTRRNQFAFYSASVDGTVRRWAVGEAAGEVVVQRDSGLRSLCAAESSEREELIAFAGYDGQIEVVMADHPEHVADHLRGHRGAVWGLSAWGRNDHLRILSAGDDATVREWRPLRGNRSAPPFAGHVGTVVSSCVVPMPGGSHFIASGGSDGTIRLWSPGGQRSSASRLRGADPLRGVCQVQSGEVKTIVTVSLSGEVCFWDLGTSKLRRPPVLAAEVPIWCVCPVQQEGHYVAAGTNDGRILLLDESGSITAAVPAHQGPVRGLVVARTGPRSKILASVGDDCRLRLWEFGQLAKRRELPRAHPGAGTISGVVAIGVSSDLDRLVTCADDGSIQVWDPVTLEAIGAPMTGHVGPVLCLSVIRPTEGRTGFIVSAGVDAMLCVWEPGRAEALLAVQTPHAGGIRDVAVVAETDDLVDVVTVGADGRVVLYSLRRTGDAVWLLAEQAVIYEGSDGGLRAVARVSGSSDDAFAVVGEAGVVTLWSVPSRRSLREPLIAASAVQHQVVPFEAEGVSYCAAIGGDGALRLWSMAGTEPIEEVVGQDWGAFAAMDLRQERGSASLATGSSDGHIRCWFAATLALRGALAGDGIPVIDVQWIDNRTLAAVLENGVVEVWDVDESARTQVIQGLNIRSLQDAGLGDGQPLLLCTDAEGRTGLLHPFTGELHEMRPLPLGRLPAAVLSVPPVGGRPLRFVAVGRDGAVDVWEPFTPHRHRALAGAAGHLQAAAWLTIGGSPVLAAGDLAGEILLWDLATEQFLESVPLGLPILALSSGSMAAAGRLLAGTARGIVCVELDPSITGR